MNDGNLWFVVGHLVCLSQWTAFLIVDYAYLGKGKVKHILLGSVTFLAVALISSLTLDVGFFTMKSILFNVVIVLLSTLLFGGTMPQKLTAALIDGTMCLLSESTVRYVTSWAMQKPLPLVWHSGGCLLAMVLTNFISGGAVAYFARQ